MNITNNEELVREINAARETIAYSYTEYAKYEQKLKIQKKKVEDLKANLVETLLTDENKKLNTEIENVTKKYEEQNKYIQEVEESNNYLKRLNLNIMNQFSDQLAVFAEKNYQDLYQKFLEQYLHLMKTQNNEHTVNQTINKFILDVKPTLIQNIIQPVQQEEYTEIATFDQNNSQEDYTVATFDQNIIQPVPQENNTQIVNYNPQLNDVQMQNQLTKRKRQSNSDSEEEVITKRSMIQSNESENEEVGDTTLSCRYLPFNVLVAAHLLTRSKNLYPRISGVDYANNLLYETSILSSMQFLNATKYYSSRQLNFNDIMDEELKSSLKKINKIKI